MVWWWPVNRDTLWKSLPCSPRQLCVPSPVQSLARAHTCAHTPRRLLLLCGEKSGTPDCSGWVRCCRRLCSLHGSGCSHFPIQEDEQSPAGKGESCTACVLLPALLAIPCQTWHPSISQELPFLASELGYQFCFCEIPLVQGFWFNCTLTTKLSGLQSMQMLQCKSGSHPAEHSQVSLLLQRWDAPGKTHERSIKSWGDGDIHLLTWSISRHNCLASGWFFFLPLRCQKTVALWSINKVFLLIKACLIQAGLVQLPWSRQHFSQRAQ